MPNQKNRIDITTAIFLRNAQKFKYAEIGKLIALMQKRQTPYTETAIGRALRQHKNSSKRQTR